MSFDLPYYDWILIFGALIFALLSLYGLKLLILKKFINQNKKQQPFVINLLSKTYLFFPAFLALYIGSSLFPEEVVPIISKVTLIAVSIQIGIWANLIFLFFIDHYKLQGDNKPAIPESSRNLLAMLGRFVIWSVIFLFLLDNLNFDVATLIAGLGIGGIAVALAVQNILGDLLASLSILIDKPFVVGDFITVDDYLGSVQYIGIKTTRLQSLGGEQIIISNSDLLKSRLRNYKRMTERRIVFNLQVPFETSVEKVAKIPNIVSEVIGSVPDSRFGRTHFNKIDSYCLNFEIVYYVLSRDYDLYMDIQQQINLKLLKAFSVEGIDFAYPTQKKL